MLFQLFSFELLAYASIALIVVIAMLSLFTRSKGTWNSASSLKSLRPFSNRSKPASRPPRDSAGEREVRRVLEQYFRTSFGKQRPKFLSNPVTGTCLELDCYNPELKLAVEYQGEQHYKYIPFFHASKEAFLNQKYRDELKRRLCAEHGVTLLEVPYSVPTAKIESYLRARIEEMSGVKDLKS